MMLFLLFFISDQKHGSIVVVVCVSSLSFSSLSLKYTLIGNCTYGKEYDYD